jgi:hypothetical protein
LAEHWGFAKLQGFSMLKMSPQYKSFGQFFLFLNCRILEPGNAEESVELDKLDELVGLVVMEVDWLDADPQPHCLRLYNALTKNNIFSNDITVVQILVSNESKRSEKNKNKKTEDFVH